MTRFLLMTLMLGACCAATFDLDGLTPEQKEIVQSAVADYERMGCSFDGNLLPRTVKIRFTAPIAGAEVGEWQGCTGVDQEEDMIRLNPAYSWHLDGEACEPGGSAEELGPFDFRSVVMHELGHALGLEHVAQPGAIMSPEIGDCVEHLVTPADVAEIRKHC